jgi:glyoxylase-like metal-dependent hydrolase (beta-lactamase superfamily II)
MTRAEEFHRVSEDLFVWEAYEPEVKCELTSCALRMGDGLVLVDPIRLGIDALDELREEAPPVRIVCTNANHARAADYYRKRFCIPVAAHAEAIQEIDIEVDETIVDGVRIEGLLEVCHIPGAVAGEIALRTPGGVVCMGDALIHLPGAGFGLLPGKYCGDEKLMRASLRKLLRWDFRVLTFAHGLPLVNNARSRLETLLT